MSTTQIRVIEQEIKALEEKLANERAKLTKFNRLPLDRRIAVYMHESLCTHNHVDGCGCEYDDVLEENTWRKGNSYYRWLEKATKLQNAIIEVYNDAQQKSGITTGINANDVWKSAVNVIDSMKGW